MPRRPAGIPAETLAQRFARRVEEEAARRGMSDAGLAQRVSAHYPMSASTIWKIKNASPPRRVDIDEATAIAVGAFGYRSIEAFLEDSPLRVLHGDERKIVALINSTAGELQELGGLVDQLIAHLEDGAIRDALRSSDVERESLARRFEQVAGLAQAVSGWAASIARSVSLAGPAIREVIDDAE